MKKNKKKFIVKLNLLAYPRTLLTDLPEDKQMRVRKDQKFINKNGVTYVKHNGEMRNGSYIEFTCANQKLQFALYKEITHELKVNEIKILSGKTDENFDDFEVDCMQLIRRAHKKYTKLYGKHRATRNDYSYKYVYHESTPIQGSDDLRVGPIQSFKMNLLEGVTMYTKEIVNYDKFSIDNLINDDTKVDKTNIHTFGLNRLNSVKITEVEHYSRGDKKFVLESEDEKTTIKSTN